MEGALKVSLWAVSLCVGYLCFSLVAPGSNAVPRSTVDNNPDEEGQVPLLDQGIKLFRDVTQFATQQADKFSDNFVQGVDLIHDTDHGVRICNEAEEFDTGVCHTQFKCNTFDGERVGFCPIVTPKTTCCKFQRTCGGESDQTVTYFNSPKPIADRDPCEFKIQSRLGACQVNIFTWCVQNQLQMAHLKF